MTSDIRHRTSDIGHLLLVIAQVAAVVGLALWILYYRAPLGNEEWHWRVRSEAVSVWKLRRPLLICLGFAALAVYLAYRIRITRRRRGGRRLLTGLYLVGLWLGSFSVAVSLFSLNTQPVPLLAWIMGSDVSTEYYRTAWEIGDLAQFGHDYPRIMEQAGYHVATHPPGAVLFYYGVIRASQGGGWGGAFERAMENTAQLTTPGMAEAWPVTVRPLPQEAIAPAVLAALITGLLGTSTVIPLYLLAAGIGRRKVGLLAAALFATTPALLFFFPTLDQVVVCLSTWSLFFVATGISRRNLLLLGLGGVVFGLDTFVSFGPLALVLVFVYLWWRSRTAGQHSSQSSGREASPAGPKATARARLRLMGCQAIIFLAGMIAVWVGVSAALGLNPLEILRAGLGAHRHVTTEAFRRTYGTWVFLNLVDFVLFLGLPTALALLWAGTRARGGLRRRRIRPQDVALAALAAILIVDVTGVVRAEVGRIWLFFMPPLVVAVAQAFRRDGGNALLIGSTATCQLAQVLVMGLMVTPVWPW